MTDVIDTLKCTGIVKWFDDKKGFGFIARDPQTETPQKEMFVHFKEIIGEGHKTLHEGQKVSFEIAEGPKGYYAKNVEALDKLSKRG